METTAFIRGQKHKAWLIGEVVKGKGEVRVVYRQASVPDVKGGILPPGKCVGIFVIHESSGAL